MTRVWSPGCRPASIRVNCQPGISRVWLWRSQTPRPLANVVRLGELHGLGGLDRTDPFDQGVGRSGGGSEATTSHTGEVRHDLVSAAGIAVSLLGVRVRFQ